MATLEQGFSGEWPGWIAASVIVLRAALGLFVHGLLRPGAPAALSRASGKVVRR